jgi:DNA-binding transcriptional ArsR family regulator
VRPVPKGRKRSDEVGAAGRAAAGAAAEGAPASVVAALFRTLGDGTRLQLLRAMTDECKSVSELAQRAGLPQPLVSHHLRILRESGLARGERRGSFVFY